MPLIGIGVALQRVLIGAKRVRGLRHCTRSHEIVHVGANASECTLEGFGHRKFVIKKLVVRTSRRSGPPRP